LKNKIYFICAGLLVGLISMTGCQTVREISATATLLPAFATILPSQIQTGTSPATITPLILDTPDPAVVQLQSLYQASLKYLAGTDAATWQVARSLGYAPLGGYPSNMCGPLAISILKEAGILSQKTSLHDFWLLNPEEDGQLLKDTFPPGFFEWLHTDLAIDTIDYKQFPLQAGDLVYIYSGSRGDYSHVLAVTRVDEYGRAYSVTNNYTDSGFMILEYLLYDPATPGDGIFYAWADPANLALGLTGFGGMDIWRPINLPYYADGAP
jgi:hypothetical protein